MSKITQWIEKVKSFFLEVKIEMKKVSWPNREQLTTYTIVVLIVILVMSFYVGIVDRVWGFFLEKFLEL